MTMTWDSAHPRNTVNDVQPTRRAQSAAETGGRLDKVSAVTVGAAASCL